MKISTKGRYALRFMVDLAANYDGGLTSIKSVAARHAISEKYLEQLAAQLARAGFVHSTRGAQGGYRLAMPPENYTVGMILREMEGSLSPVGCLDGNADCAMCSGGCDTQAVWRSIKQAVEDVVDGMTLADLAARRETRLEGKDTETGPEKSGLSQAKETEQ